jgi:molecular chaperone DnaJ
VEVIVDISFVDAVFGSQQEIRVRSAVACDDCGGSGAAQGTQPTTCSECRGAGQVRRVRQSVLGQMVTTSACPRCNGVGQMIASPCGSCRGEGRVVKEVSLNVEVPAGVDTGQTLRLTGRGAVGPRGGAAGDLYVHMRVAAHDRWRREDDDLVTDVPVSIAQAALGTELDLETLDGEEHLVVPAGVQHGHEFTLRGRGVPRLGQGGRTRGRGNLRARVVVEVPTKLSSQERDALRRFAESRGEPVSDEGIVSKIKSAFS